MQKVYQSLLVPFDEVTEQLSIGQFIANYNPEGVPDDKIVHTDDFGDAHITYGGLRKSCGQLAWGLRNSLGLKEGDTILALVPNSNDFVYLAHATWWAGGIYAPVNTAATQSDVEHILKLLRPSYVAVTASKLEVVQKAINSVKSQRPKIFTILDRVSGFSKFPEDIRGSSDSETLPPFDLTGRDARKVPSTICMSSGTTGKMKGVQLSHYNLISNVLQLRYGLPNRNTASVREVWFPPYCHIYGMIAVVLAGMFNGGRFHAMKQFDLGHFCQKIIDIDATDMHIVPPVALLLATSPAAQKYNITSMQSIVIAAAPLKAELQLKLKARFPKASVCQGYGLTECSPSVSLQRADDTAVGSVGKLLPGTKARFVHPESLEDVPEGAEGELWIQGPQVMMGYVNDEESTKQSFSNGWLRTGDIAKMVGDDLWITDRFKEMIKYKGLQVAPSELEDLLLQHPDVIDSAVCSTYSDAEATEVPLAYVSLVPSKVNLSSAEKEKVLKEIRVWADSKLAGYKKLRGGVFHLQVLPKSPTGKILRRMLPKPTPARPQKL